MRSLIQRCQLLAEERAALAADLVRREDRIAALEGQVRELNQVRRDVAKRIDDLIGQIDHLDAQRGSARS